MKKYDEIPIGFLFALTEDKSAMRRFCHLSDEELDAVIDRARHALSREDMRVLALSLSEGMEAGELVERSL